jgi:hypothetical protein
LENLKARYRFEDLSIDGEIMLKLILKEVECVVDYTG